MAERFLVQQITSLTGKQTRLRALANNAMNLVKQAQEETAQHIIQEAIENYDTAEPGETYERTGRLAEGWFYIGPDQMPDDTVRTVIANSAIDDSGRAYSSLVQGEEQTERHASAGWRTADEIAKAHSTEQGNRVRAAIRRASEL